MIIDEEYIDNAVDFINKSNDCTCASLINLDLITPGFNRSLAFAIMNIESSISILAKIKNELTKSLLESLEKEIKNEEES